jgi:hypothetical protein
MNLAGNVVRLYSRNSLSLRTLWVLSATDRAITKG